MNPCLIISNPHTPKASLVRSLTGGFNRSVGAVQDSRSSVEDFVVEADSARCQTVLFSLSPSFTARPDAQAYVESIMAVAALGHTSGGARGSNLRSPCGRPRPEHRLPQFAG